VYLCHGKDATKIWGMFVYLYLYICIYMYTDVSAADKTKYDFILNLFIPTPAIASCQGHVIMEKNAHVRTHRPVLKSTTEVSTTLLLIIRFNVFSAICTYTYMYKYTYIHMYVYMYILGNNTAAYTNIMYTYKCMNIHVYIYVLIYI